jgi:O-antigen/teichoic acid export membrane protein
MGMNSEDLLAQTPEPSIDSFSDIDTLAIGITTSMGGKVFRSGIDFLRQVLLARVLGPSTFGLYSLGWSILRISELIAPLGLQNGVLRFGAYHWPDDLDGLKSVINKSIRLVLLSSLILGGFLYSLASWISTTIFDEPALPFVIRLIAISIPLVSCMRVVASATRISQRLKFSVMAEEIGQPFANLTVAISLLLLGAGLTGAVSAVPISFGFGLILSIYFLRNMIREVSRQRNTNVIHEEKIYENASLLKFSTQTGLAGLFTGLLIWIDRLLIGYYLPSTEVGIYQAISQFSIIFLIILGAMNSIFSPMIAFLYHRHELDRLSSLYKISTKWGLYLSLPLFVVVVSSARQLIATVFGIAYEGAYVALIILATAQIINIGVGAVGYLLMMTGKQNYWLVTSASILILGTTLNIFLIPRYGLMGAALATGIATSTLNIIGLLQTKNYLHLWPYDRRYIKGLLAFLVVFIVMNMPPIHGLTSTLGGLIFVSMISVSLFFIVLYLMKFDSEDRELIKLIQTRIFQR